MAVGNRLSQIGSKQLTERYEYPAPAHDQHLYYAYEPTLPSHGHVASTKYSHNGSGHKNNAAMSALTLLAFLFFLHILQQCLKEHMTSMSTPQVMVVSAGRETEQSLVKTLKNNKLDKAGIANDETIIDKADVKTQNKLTADNNAPFTNEENVLMKIETAEHVPDYSIHKNKFTSFSNKSSPFSGYISAMDKK